MNGLKLVHGNHHILGENNGYFYCYRESEEYSMQSHIHSHYEIIYIVEGRCIYTIEDKEYFLSPGDLVFTRPNEFHAISFPEKCSYKRHFLHIYPDFIKDYPELTEFLTSKAPMHYIPSEYVPEYGIDKCFEAMSRCNIWSEPGTCLLSLGCALHIFAAMIRLADTKTKPLNNTVPNKNIRKILHYIDTNYTKNPSLDEIANAIYLTPVHVSRLFKTETGMTLRNYINMRKIVLAKNLIMAGEQLISLPEKCGFENYSTFYRSFIKHVGVSPEKFKIGLRNSSI